MTCAFAIFSFFHEFEGEEIQRVRAALQSACSAEPILTQAALTNGGSYDEEEVQTDISATISSAQHSAG